MQWFGKRPWAPLCDDCPKVDTPIGMRCKHCDEQIIAGDDGVTIPLWYEGGFEDIVLHYECNLRRVIGGLNHLKKRCTCCGGTEPPDPPELSRRDAARIAVAYWERTR